MAQQPPPPAMPGLEGHDLHHSGRPRITWSGTEAAHLAMAVAALTLCFAFFRHQNVAFGEKLQATLADGWALLACFAAAATGFVLHELAHKVAAHHYGHWAEFRADFRYLLGALAFALFFPFFVAAPGAVWIQGRPPARQYGLISIVGPGLNVAVCSLSFGTYLLLESVNPTFGLNPEAPLELVLGMVAVLNGFLALFNLVPIRLPFLGSLDGLKVWRWSRTAWLLGFLTAAGLFTWVYVKVGFNLFPL